MNKKTLIALKKSIENWVRKAKGMDMDKIDEIKEKCSATVLMFRREYYYKVNLVQSLISEYDKEKAESNKIIKAMAIENEKKFREIKKLEIEVLKWQDNVIAVMNERNVLQQQVGKLIKDICARCGEEKTGYGSFICDDCIGKDVDEVEKLKQQLEKEKEYKREQHQTLITQKNRADKLQQQLAEKDRRIAKIEGDNRLIYDKYKKIEKQLSQSIKYKRFVEHIYSHRLDLKGNLNDNQLPMNDWVKCKICNRTINMLSLSNKEKEE